MKYIQLMAIIFVVFNCEAQKQSINLIEGKWHVQRVHSLLPGSYNENKDEYDERMQQDSICKLSTLSITSHSFKLDNKECMIQLCDSSIISGYFIPVVKDTKYTINSNGDEIEEKKIVGKRFMNIVDKHFNKSKILIYYTDCPSGDGDSKDQIIYLNSNQIVLYRGFELIWLSRVM